MRSFVNIRTLLCRCLLREYTVHLLYVPDPRQWWSGFFIMIFKIEGRETRLYINRRRRVRCDLLRRVYRYGHQLRRLRRRLLRSFLMLFARMPTAVMVDISPLPNAKKSTVQFFFLTKVYCADWAVLFVGCPDGSKQWLWRYQLRICLLRRSSGVAGWRGGWRAVFSL